VLLRLFAPFLPCAGEEAWSWGRGPAGPLPGFESASVHRSLWPARAELQEPIGAEFPTATDLSGLPAGTVLAVAAEVLGRIRTAKSDAKRSVRAEVARVKVVDTGPRLAAVRAVREDLRSAGNVAELITVERADGAQAGVEVQLLENHPTTS
jgi:valyl-tRNA synthetase